MRTCFVIMPYGKKTDPYAKEKSSRKVIDFEKVYGLSERSVEDARGHALARGRQNNFLKT